MTTLIEIFEAFSKLSNLQSILLFQFTSFCISIMVFLFVNRQKRESIANCICKIISILPLLNIFINIVDVLKISYI